ncbi:MAG: OB-fold nucleic acid binding domain-containing protein, partial [Trebonia sp.]
LPRRGYAPLLGRILHDRTADKIAEVVSRVPNAAATIIPFDVESRVHLLHATQAARLAGQAGNGAQASNGAQGGDGAQAAGGTPARDGAQAGESEKAAVVRTKEVPKPATSGTAAPNGSAASPPRVAGITAIGELNGARKATVEGRVRSVEIHPVENSCVFDATITDETGTLTAKFYGRSSIPGFEPGTRVRLVGKVSMREGGPAMINPAYELLARGE